MNIKDKMCKIEEILDVEEGTLTETTQLSELEEWDSIAKLSLTIMLDEDYGKKITSQDLKELQTVEMILNLMN